MKFLKFLVLSLAALLSDLFAQLVPELHNSGSIPYKVRDVFKIIFNPAVPWQGFVFGICFGLAVYFMLRYKISLEETFQFVIIIPLLQLIVGSVTAFLSPILGLVHIPAIVFQFTAYAFFIGLICHKGIKLGLGPVGVSAVSAAACIATLTTIFGISPVPLTDYIHTVIGCTLAAFITRD